MLEKKGLRRRKRQLATQAGTGTKSLDDKRFEEQRKQSGRGGGHSKDHRHRQAATGGSAGGWVMGGGRLINQGGKRGRVSVKKRKADMKRRNPNLKKGKSPHPGRKGEEIGIEKQRMGSAQTKDRHLRKKPARCVSNSDGSNEGFLGELAPRS